MKWIVFKKQEETNKVKSLSTLLKNETLSHLSISDLSKIKGGDGDEESKIPIK